MSKEKISVSEIVDLMIQNKNLTTKIHRRLCKSITINH